MVGRKRSEVPTPLQVLAEGFSSWRMSRTPGQRIPESLWSRAVEVAREYGISRTVSVLKLDYYSLKRRLEQSKPSADEQPTTFVELPSAITLPPGECTIEFEDGRGARLRVHVKGAELPDVVELGRSFWNAD